MNRTHLKSLAPIIGGLMLITAPSLVSGQSPGVLELPFTGGLPPEVDFGDVEVGTTVLGDLIILNLSQTASYEVSNIDLPQLPGAAISLVGPFDAFVVGPGEQVTVEFEFKPPFEGTFNTVAIVNWMESNSSSFLPPMPMVTPVGLTGNGITGGVLDPLALIDKIIEDFDAGVADGSITGVSPGNRWGRGMGLWRVAYNRLRTLSFMLNSARWLIANEHYDWAAWMVESVYKHVDGWGRPADFATGPGLESIRDDLLTLLDLLP